jgi:two-component system response regulator BaeR
MAQTILIVEDEPRLRGLLADYLKAAGFVVREHGDGRGVPERVQAERPDLVLLDLMLPGGDGLDICRVLRATASVPIIITTARVDEIDRLLGLELGADDYICKPYSPREVVARVKAVLRRGTAPMKAARGPLTIDADALRVRAEGREVELTPVELALLQTLYNAPGRIFSRELLMGRMYDDHRVVSDRTIDSHVKKLRRKLQGLLPGRELIHSVYGAGYRYEDRAAA